MRTSPNCCRAPTLSALSPCENVRLHFAQHLPLCSIGRPSWSFCRNSRTSAASPPSRWFRAYIVGENRDELRRQNSLANSESFDFCRRPIGGEADAHRARPGHGVASQTARSWHVCIRFNPIPARSPILNPFAKRLASCLSHAHLRFLGELTNLRRF